MPRTSSPTEKPSTSAATPSTTPETSVPGMIGRAIGGLISGGTLGIPSRRYQSGGFRPTACTRTSTSPGFGSGTGTSSYRSTSGPPNSWIRIAFIVGAGMALAFHRGSDIISGAVTRIYTEPCSGCRATKMRADAKKNYDHLLEVARAVVVEHGSEASLRDIARRAGVGLGTLYRHFPTREALLEALLRTSFDELKARADELEASSSPETGTCLLATGRRGMRARIPGRYGADDGRHRRPRVRPPRFVRHDARRRHTAPSPAPRRRARRGPTSTAPTCSRSSQHSHGSAINPPPHPAPNTSSAWSPAPS